MRVLGTTLLGLLVALAPLRAGAAPSLRFHVPDGWVNLGPDAAKDALALAPPGVVDAVKGGHFLAYALDGAQAPGAFTENFNAVPTDLPGRVTLKLVDEVVGVMGAEIRKEYPGTTYDVQEKGLRTVAGVTAGRWVADATVDGVRIRQVVYLLPGAEQGALVTYSTTPEEFATYQPVFDDAAARTTGLVEPPGSDEPGPLFGLSAGAVRAALVGGVAAVILVLLRRRARAQERG